MVMLYSEPYLVREQLARKAQHGIDPAEGTVCDVLNWQAPKARS